MRVEIDLRKSAQENAALHYEKAKKIRKKIVRLLKAIEQTKKEIAEQKIPAPVKKKIQKEREWYEKFHWMRTATGLALGGRDAKSNAQLVKKHMQAQDLFFHADVHGAPAVILSNGQSADSETLAAVAQFAGCFSNAWKTGAPCDVYCVKPNQVKTAAGAGEFLAKGAFVIEGQRQWFKKIEMQLAVAVVENKVVAWPEQAVKKLSKEYLTIIPDPAGKKGDAAKAVLFRLKKIFPDAEIDINDILAALPNGGSRIK